MDFPGKIRYDTSLKGLVSLFFKGGLPLFDRLLSKFCYRHPRFGIPNLMRYIAIGNIIVFLLDLVSDGYCSALLSFIPAAILHGQVWRVITFVFIPVNSNPIWFVLSLFLYYSLGTALERTWGTAKFNLFYLIGFAFTIVGGIIAMAARPEFAFASAQIVNMYYVNMSLFFAFAALNPDATFLLYFIIPVKAKWLAWFDMAFFAIQAIRYLAAGLWPMALIIALSFVNCFLYFGSDIGAMFGRAKRTAHRKTINFEQARRQQDQTRRNQSYTHKCAVCGITDADDPNEEFRYCSKCNGYYCYCSKHIHNHIHIQ